MACLVQAIFFDNLPNFNARKPQPLGWGGIAFFYYGLRLFSHQKYHIINSVKKIGYIVCKLLLLPPKSGRFISSLSGGTVKEGSPMTVESRIFSVAEYVQPSEGEPIRSVVLETRDSIIVVWHVHPGQEIAAHIHPHGQDTWTVLSGMADYFQGNGIVRALREGEIAVARPGQVHGARNTGTEPFVFVSVVASANAGFVLAER